MYVDLNIIFKYFAAIFFIVGYEWENAVNNNKGDIKI